MRYLKPTNKPVSQREALRNDLERIKQLPYQEGWDDALLDEDFLGGVLAKSGQAEAPTWHSATNRLLAKGSICTDCTNAGGTKAGSYECPKRLWVLDVPAMLDTSSAILQVIPCPLYQKHTLVQQDIEAPGMLDISVDSLSRYSFEGMLYPPGDSQAKDELIRAGKTCKAYIKDYDGHWLYIYSRVNGTGKTRLAIATAREFIANGGQARYINFPTLYAYYKAQLGTTDDADESMHNNMQAFAILPAILEFSGLLILDDLGKEVPSPRSLEWLYLILDARYMLNLPTILTSNYDPEHLRAYYSGTNVGYATAILSRILGQVGEVTERTLIQDTYQISLDRQIDRRRVKPR